MSAHFPPLPPVVAPLEALPALEAISSKYNFVFQLDEEHEPVDPIIAAIRSAERVRNLPPRAWKPQEPRQDITSGLHPAESSLEGLWKRAHTAPPVVRKNDLLTWDSLRWPELRDPVSPALVSELSTPDFDAVLYHVADGIGAQHSVPLSRIFHHLPALLTGCSSELFLWDDSQELFFIQDNGYRIDELRVEGIDTAASQSFLDRFLNTGSLLRRLETMVDAMRTSRQPPTFHEFLHGLDATLTYLKISLGAPHPYATNRLASIWFYYQEPAEILDAVAQLCNRGRTKRPPYQPLPASDIDLLSHLYRILLVHVQSCASKPVRAISAYILQLASRSYLAGLEERVGMFKKPLTSNTEPVKPPTDDLVLDLTDGETEQDGADVASSDANDSRGFAAFVPADLVIAIPLARRSLRILQSAKVDLATSDINARCQWQWADEAVAGDGGQASIAPPTIPWFTRADLPLPATSEHNPYPPPLAALRVFDMEPGSHAFTTSVNGVSFSMSQLPLELVNFIASFPDTFSPATPSLEYISSRTLQPVLDHSRMLSMRLLWLFLESSNLHAHLTVMRDYLLMTGYSFKSHLVAALFTDSHAPSANPAGGILQFRRRTVHRSERPEADSRVHGVALRLGGYGVAHSDWPPGAADISFSLRRVIVDALDDSDYSDAGDPTADIWRQAEVRLGFGLREIPDNAVTEGWFDPDRLEALDFLYLVYRPPHPLDQVVLTSEIMAKYQRVFAFLLRLLRIEEVCRVIHQCANSRAHTTDTPVFTLFPPTRKLLSLFCFQVQTFITALSGYVFDVAIGKRFDRLLVNVENLRNHISQTENKDGGLDTAMDVFALADYHSAVLDQILAGCLLRSKQSTAGEALRDCMTAVLDLGRLVVRVTSRDLADILGAQELEDIHQRFERSMIRLVSIVRSLSEKSSSKPTDNKMDGEWRRRHGFVVDPHDLHSDMSQFLQRLDGSGWWRRAAGKTQES